MANFEYDMGITIVYEDNSICYCMKYGCNYYDKTFSAVIEMIECGEWSEVFDRYIDSIYSDYGGIDNFDHVDPKYCPFYGG